jgi:hypothetical protein
MEHGTVVKSRVPVLARYLPELNAVVIVLLITNAVLAWRTRFWPVTLLCWPVLAYCGHVLLLSFHEVAHRNLGYSAIGNEIRGVRALWNELLEFVANDPIRCPPRCKAVGR